MSKYTKTGSKQIDSLIDEQLSEISKGVENIFHKDDLSALVLGGGYGRGEGGVLMDDGKEYLYNDYDFFIIVNSISNRKKSDYHRKLNELSEELTSRIGIDVDFSPPVYKTDIIKMPFTQMWSELKHGHMVICGDKNIMAHYPHDDLEKLPITEILKLLLNRGTGLLLARERMTKEKLDKDDCNFILRNIYKAGIALGDATLLSQKKFHHLYLKRLDLLNNFFSETKADNDIGHSNDIKNIYKESIDFKLSPFIERDKEKIVNLFNRVYRVFEKVYYSVFSKYYGKEIKDYNDYSRLVYIDNNSGSWLKNIYLNFRDLKLKSFSLHWYLKYPRFRLFYTLPFFLFNHQENNYGEYSDKIFNHNKKNYKIGFTPPYKALCRDSSSTEIELLEAFLNLWKVYN